MGIIGRIREAVAAPVVDRMIEASRAELRLKLEELDWNRITTSGREEDSHLADLATQREKMAVLARTDPFAKRVLHINTQFTFGEGLTTPTVRLGGEKRRESQKRIREAGFTPDEEKGQKIISEFWELNRDSVFGLLAQHQRVYDLLFIGDIFLHIRPNEDGICRVSPLDEREIVDVVAESEDYLVPRFFVRQFRPLTYNPLTRKYEQEPERYVHYRALGNEEAPPEGEEGWVLQIAVNKFKKEKFGRPLVECLLGWLQGRKGVAEDAMTVFSSLAAFAWKETVTGGRRAQDIAKAGVTAAESNTLRVPPGAGSIRVETTGRDLEAINKPKIGGDAWDVVRIAMNAIASGSDLSEHYFGNAADSNLATATALEYPVLKAFQWWRGYWLEQYEKLFQFQLKMAGLEGLVVDVDFPPLGARNVGEYVKAVVDAEASNLIPREEAAQAIMQALTLEDTEYALDLLRADWEEQDNAVTAPLPVGPPVGQPNANVNPKPTP